MKVVAVKRNSTLVGAMWTDREVAEQLGVHASTLARMVRRGDAPPHVQLAGRRRWRPAAVSAWLEAQEVSR